MHRKLFFLNEFEKVQIQRKGFHFMEMKLFGKTCEMGQIILKIVLLHKMSNIQKSKLFWYFETFSQGSYQKKTSLEDLKIRYLSKKLRITQNVNFFSTRSKRGIFWGKIFDLMVKKFFRQTTETGQIYPKTVLRLKMYNIQLNYVFLEFWCTFAANWKKILSWS